MSKSQLPQAQLTQAQINLASDVPDTFWINDLGHKSWLKEDAQRQLQFFSKSLRSDGGFDVLDHDGSPIKDSPQELHTTTRLVHSYALGKAAGFDGCDDIIDAGLSFLERRHRDATHGGYGWSVQGDEFADDTKLAYGHVFVLLAGASAKSVGHARADALIEDVTAVICERYWDSAKGLLCDEFTRDWQPFSSYRGFNANMHGTEAFLSAYEATGQSDYLKKAGQILSFFVDEIAANHEWRIPEHFDQNWTVDLTYEGNPMFRPKGTTPGHSFELARLLIQYWDLGGRADQTAVAKAKNLVMAALKDAWLEQGGFAYTLDYDGKVQIADRYWWPMTEAIGALATLLKLSPDEDLEHWYRTIWTASADLFIDSRHGGWRPEVDAQGQPAATQFVGKPDIYHALQADLLPTTPRVSHIFAALMDQAL